jgi:hypothetical protein
VFITAVSTVSKMWKQPTHPPVGEWAHKMWSTHTLNYSALKDLKTFILSEISQAQKVRYSGSTLSCLEQSSSWRQTVEWVARAGRGMLGVSVWCGGFGFREMSSSGDEQWLDCSMLWMCLKMVKMSQAQWHTAVILALYWGRRIGSSRPTWAT